MIELEREGIMHSQWDAIVEVGQDRTVTIKAPDAVPIGPCRVSVLFQPTEPGTRPRTGQFTDGWATFDVGLTDPNETFRREDIYGNDGR